MLRMSRRRITLCVIDGSHQMSHKWVTCESYIGYSNAAVSQFKRWLSPKLKFSREMQKYKFLSKPNRLAAVKSHEMWK